jgi:transcriptional regulator with XRE-family HTH domain
MDARDLAIRVGARVRKRRETLALSQAQLAEAAGVSPNYVGVVERGEKLPTLETLESFAQALSVGLGGLLDDKAAPDKWADETAALVRSIPASHRHLAVALLRALFADAHRVRRARTRRRAHRRSQ